jgi:uncharacterized protein HemX
VSGVDEGALATIVGSLAGVVGALAGWWGRRRAETRADRAEAREARTAELTAEQNAQVAAIAERQALIDAINDALVTPLRKEIGELRERLDKAEKKIDTLEDRNDRLVAFIYKLIGIIRRAGVDNEILPADVPPGIHL